MLKCEFCQKTFSRSEQLTRHRRKHTKEKPYPCLIPGCKKFFSRSDNRFQHMLVHQRRNTQGLMFHEVNAVPSSSSSSSSLTNLFPGSSSTVTPSSSSSSSSTPQNTFKNVLTTAHSNVVFSTQWEMESGRSDESKKTEKDKLAHQTQSLKVLHGERRKVKNNMEQFKQKNNRTSSRDYNEEEIEMDQDESQESQESQESHNEEEEEEEEEEYLKDENIGGKRKANYRSLSNSPRKLLPSIFEALVNEEKESVSSPLPMMSYDNLVTVRRYSLPPLSDLEIGKKESYSTFDKEVLNKLTRHSISFLQK